jgi:hypothetical protein
MPGKNDDVLAKYSKAWQQLSEKAQQQALQATKVAELERVEGPAAPQQSAAGNTQALEQQLQRSGVTLEAAPRESLGRLPVRETPGNRQAGIAPQQAKSLMSDYYAGREPSAAAGLDQRHREVLAKYASTPAASQDKERPKDLQPEKEPGS